MARGKKPGTTQVSLEERNAIELLARKGRSKAEIARIMGRSRPTVHTVIEQAKHTLETAANKYAEIHLEAAKQAAKKGRGLPAQWALERLGVVKPAEAEASKGPSIRIGIMLPGLSADSKMASLDGVVVKALPTNDIDNEA